MQTTVEQLQHWLAEPEGIRLEFQEAKYNSHFEKLVEYCMSLANEGGGKIILGVTDRRPRRIVGTTAFAEPGCTEAGLHDRLSRRVSVEEVRTADVRVLPSMCRCDFRARPGRSTGGIASAGDELPALSRSKIHVLLRKLRKERPGHSVGATKAARWFPGAGPANCNLGEASP